MRRLLREDPELLALALIVLLFAAWQVPLRWRPDFGHGMKIERPMPRIVRL